jgi:hypothetical protein
MRYQGKVVRQSFGKGSKSEHSAVVLLTAEGPLKLRRVNSAESYRAQSEWGPDADGPRLVWTSRCWKCSPNRPMASKVNLWTVPVEEFFSS